MKDKKQTGTWKKVLSYISRYKVLLFYYSFVSLCQCGFNIVYSDYCW